MNRVAKSLIAAATLLPAVAVPTAGAAAVLTFSPLPGAAQILGGNPLLPPDLFPDNMVDALGGYVCRNPDNSCTSVIYSPLSIQQGVDMLSGALPGALAVDPPYINPAGDGKVIVFAYSQGGQVVQQWMKQNAVPNGGAAPGVDPDDVSFFLYANSTRKYGGSLAYGWANLFGQEVMPETAYDVTDISRQYDYATDFPDDPFNSLAVMNAIMGAVFIHGDYIFLNPDDPANAVWTEHNSLGGSIKYILVPTTNLPLLEPLRRIGLTALADSLNGPLKAFIELAYKRPAPFPVVSDPANARIASAENTLQLSLATGGEAAAEQTPESNGTEPTQGSENLELTEGSDRAHQDPRPRAPEGSDGPSSSPKDPRTSSSPKDPRTSSSPKDPRTSSSPKDPRTSSSPKDPRTFS